MTKFLAWFVRRVSIVTISLRTIAVLLVTASSTILFIFIFPRILDEAFSIASTILAMAVFTLSKPSLVSFSAKGLHMSSKLLGWGANSTYL